MKYRIKKINTKSLEEVTHSDTSIIYKTIEIKKSTYYIASRKRRIFGFWHAIGHKYDWDGNLERHTTSTLEEMEDYIYKYHEVNYSKEPCEIIKLINI